MTPPSFEECAVLLSLAWDAEHWIARRSCHVSFVNEAIVARRTTCEVDLHSTATGLVHNESRSRFHVPAWGVTRKPARNLTICDSQGVSTPYCTREQERVITARGLAHLTLESFGALPNVAGSVADLESTAAHIQHVIDPDYGFPLPDEHAAWREVVISDFAELDSILEAVQAERLVIALPSIETSSSDWPFALTEAHVEALVVRRSSWALAFKTWRGGRNTSPASNSTFASWRYIATQRPDGSRAPDFPRSIVTSDGSVMAVQHADGGHADSAFRSTWRWAWWMPDTFILNYPVDDFLEASSYHIEIECPSGVYISHANLRVVNKGLSGNEMIIVTDDDLHPDRAHLHFTRRLSRRSPEDDNEYKHGSLRVVLRPTFHDGLRAAAHLSVASCLVLWVLFATLGWSESGRDCWVCLFHLGNFDTNSVVSVLILAPSIGLGIMARQNEYNLTKRIHSRLRLRLAGLSLILFFTALFVALRPRSGELFGILLLSAILCSIVTLYTVVSAIYSRLEIRSIMSGVRASR